MCYNNYISPTEINANDSRFLSNVTLPEATRERDMLRLHFRYLFLICNSGIILEGKGKQVFLKPAASLPVIYCNTSENML